MKYLFFLSTLCILSVGCGNETIENDGTLNGKEYFPVAEGREWIYQVDSIIYDANLGTVINSSGFIKEVIAEKNDDEFTINRYTGSSLENLRLSDVWAGRIEGTRAIKIEENLPFIKMVFPPSLGASWLGNALFSNDVEVVIAGEPLSPFKVDWNYEITETGGLYENGDLSLSGVVTIQNVDLESILDIQFQTEKYAPEVGLVEKRAFIAECCSNGGQISVPWVDKAERGYQLTQRLISYK